MVFEGHDARARRRRGRRGVFVGGAADQPGDRRGAAPRGIPVIPRAEMLAELMRLRFSIAVAGSHGKTTTTSMIALVLERAGLDPTAVIGGRLSAFGSNARLGRGEYMVAEADESDRSFLMLWPSIAVMTNIDDEHMESYGSFADLQQAFVDFANKVPFYGARRGLRRRCEPRARCCRAMTAPRRDLRPRRRRDAHIRRDVTSSSARSAAACVVYRRDARAASRRSAAASFACRAGTTCRTRSRPSRSAHRARPRRSSASPRRCASFHGAERRFERHGEAGGVLVVDDYGHHPTEIAAVLAAARATLGRRLVVAFQPHRYSRTRAAAGRVRPGARATPTRSC